MIKSSHMLAAKYVSVRIIHNIAVWSVKISFFFINFFPIFQYVHMSIFQYITQRSCTLIGSELTAHIHQVEFGGSALWM